MGILSWLGWTWAGWWLAALVAVIVFDASGASVLDVVVGIFVGRYVLRPLYRKWANKDVLTDAPSHGPIEPLYRRPDIDH